MTAQANYSLLKQGIAIETQPIEELVEKLKTQENAYYTSLLSQSGIKTSQEKMAVFADSQTKAKELKDVPAYIL